VIEHVKPKRSIEGGSLWSIGNEGATVVHLSASKLARKTSFVVLGKRCGEISPTKEEDLVPSNVY